MECLRLVRQWLTSPDRSRFERALEMIATSNVQSHKAMRDYLAGIATYAGRRHHGWVLYICLCVSLLLNGVLALQPRTVSPVIIYRELDPVFQAMDTVFDGRILFIEEEDVTSVTVQDGVYVIRT